MDTPTTKVCTKCLIEKPLDAFRNDKYRPNGKTSKCRECLSKRRKKLHPEEDDKARVAKICTQCKILKPLDDFGKNHTLKDGKMSACKACHKLKNKMRYDKFKHRYAPVYAAYRARNKQKIADDNKTYRKNERHKGIPSYKNRPLIKHRYRARKLALPDTWTQEQLTFMLDYWHDACAVCGNMKGLLWTLAHDHWIPISSPDCPGTIAENMIPLCHGDGGCNNSKRDFDPHKWLVGRFGPKKAAKIEKTIAAYFAAVALAFGQAAS